MAENSLPIDSEISQALLRRLFRYNPATGVLTWKERPQGPDWWNRRYAGKRAGCLNNSSGYVLVKIKGKKRLAHRLIWLYVYGKWPSLHIDHINRDPLDNRLKNLRDVSRSVNMLNRDFAKMRAKKPPSLGGVSVVRRTGRWRAYYYVGAKQRHVGMFETRDQALNALRQLVK